MELRQATNEEISTGPAAWAGAATNVSNESITPARATLNKFFFFMADLLVICCWERIGSSRSDTSAAPTGQRLRLVSLPPFESRRAEYSVQFPDILERRRKSRPDGPLVHRVCHQ